MSLPNEPPSPQGAMGLPAPAFHDGEAPADGAGARQRDVPRLWPERFVALSAREHREFGWRRAALVEAGPAPLLPHELVEAAAFAPIGLRLLGEIAVPQVYLPAPGTASGFRPALWGHYPFGLGLRAGGVSCLTVDRTALAPLGGPDVEPLFDADGGLLPRYNPLIRDLEARAVELRQGAALAAPWAARGALEPVAELWPEGQVCLSHRLIRPQALTELSAREAGALHESGALAFAYAAVVSRQHLAGVMDSWRRYADRGPAPLRAPRRPASTVESFLTALGHDLNLF